MWGQLVYATNNLIITICYKIYWRKGWDSNPRYPCRHAGFQDRCLKPLGHPSHGPPHEGTRRGLQAIAQAGDPVNRRAATATIDSPPRGSPHFRRVRDAISLLLGAEVGCIGAQDRRMPRSGHPGGEMVIGGA